MGTLRAKGLQGSGQDPLSLHDRVEHPEKEKTKKKKTKHHTLHMGAWHTRA